ncbi:hypothetical protein L1887_49706 [Cichorium endivia]|nr:hypothetical protein L1887_49706 [Cichorium endivia]
MDDGGTVRAVYSIRCERSAFMEIGVSSVRRGDGKRSALRSRPYSSSPVDECFARASAIFHGSAGPIVENQRGNFPEISRTAAVKTKAEDPSALDARASSELARKKRKVAMRATKLTVPFGVDVRDYDPDFPRRFREGGRRIDWQQDAFPLASCLPEPTPTLSSASSRLRCFNPAATLNRRISKEARVYQISFASASASGSRHLLRTELRRFMHHAERTEAADAAENPLGMTG